MKNEIRKQKRKLEMIQAAQKLFAEKGIEQTTFQEIADVSGFGVASIYRYFANKTQLAIAATTDIWKSWDESVDSMQNLQGNGLQKLDRLIDSAILHFQSNPSLLRLVENFDNYISNLSELPAEMKDYEEEINHNIPLITLMIQEGLEDGSLRPDLNVEDTLYTILHTLMSLAQKVFLRGYIIPQDKEHIGPRELYVFKEMIIHYVKNPKI